MALTRWILRGVALASLTGVLAECDAAPAVARAPQARAPERFAIADTATLDLPRTYDGQVFVERDVAIAARAAGALDSLFVNLGAVVKGGEPLAVVESRSQEIAAASARERLVRARSALTRSRILSKSGGVTSPDSEAVAGEFAQAELSVQKAEHDLVLTRVTAPFDGVVTARYARPHQLVGAGDTLLRLAETAPQLVRVRIGEPAARTVSRGDRAEVRASVASASSSTRVIASSGASVAFVSPALDPASGTREVILRLASPRLLVGESVRVLMGSERRIAIVAPRALVSRDGYVLVADGARTTLRPVTVGADVPGDRVEIVSGLAAGEHLAPLRR